MLFKPDEVTNLKNGKRILVELKEGDVRVLKRNFCGVYELFHEENPLNVEYFEDLNLFKNRYGSIHRKFPLHNISRQRLDIYPITQGMEEREILKWFGAHGKVRYKKTVKMDQLEIRYYIWISDTENTLSGFQLVGDGEGVTLNISAKNLMDKVKMVG
jgi:hypothetical protein